MAAGSNRGAGLAGTVRRPRRGAAARTGTTTTGRASALGASGGAVLAGLVASVDAVRALSDAGFRASYGVWSGIVVAVPVGAVVGLVCALAAVAVHRGLRGRERLPRRLLSSLGAAGPLVLVGAASVSASAFVACVVLGACASGFAFLTYPLVTRRTSPAADETARPAT